MGEVYRACDPRLGRDVAIKVLPEGLDASPERRSRFEREARAVAALSHPNVVALFDYGHEGDRTYAVSELLEGQTLRERMNEGLVPPRKAVEWATQAARGLAAAHDRGIVHRDLKPENLFVTRDGIVKVLDFGLARHALSPVLQSEDTHSPTLVRSTEPGTLLGTVGYMSPEQARGQEADARSDIFSLGAVLYEMLSGRRAFARDTAAETLTAILREEPGELPPSVPAALERIVRHCLEKRPEERFHTAHDLAFALENAFGSSAASGTSLVPPARRPQWLRAAALAGAGALLLALGFGIGRGSVPAVGSAAAPSFRKLTDGAALKSDPSLSPDGKTFAYVTDQAGNPDIYLQRVGGGNPINLTKESPEADGEPAFSPDGERIAFRSNRQGGGIFVMGATGESVRRLADSGHDPAWSPDGSEIVVAGDTTERVADRGGLDSPLWAVRVADGSRRLVAETDSVHPAWSPGGRRIAFWGLVRPGSQRDLWTVAADGSEAKTPVPLTIDASIDWSPAWSADGRFLFFASDRSGPLAIHRLPIDEVMGRALGPPVGLGSPTPYTAGLSFASDGRTAVFEGRVPRERLLVVPLDSRSELAGPPRVAHESSDGIEEIALSADGRLIATDSRSREGEDLWVLRSDGSERRMLTQDRVRDRGPCWSPDGQWIVFRSEREGGWGLWAVRPDGSGLKRIASPGLVWNLTWSPSEPVLAGYDGGGGRAVLVDWAVGSDAAVIRELPALGPGRVFRPSGWSPDGHRVLGTATGTVDETSQGVYAFDVRASRYERILGRRLSWPSWAEDGSLLGLGPEGVTRVDPRTGQSKVILPGRLSALQVSADRRTLVVVEDLTASDIWLMTLP